MSEPSRHAREFYDINAEGSELHLIGLVIGDVEQRTIARALIPTATVFTHRKARLIWEVLADLDREGRQVEMMGLFAELQARPSTSASDHKTLMDELGIKWISGIVSEAAVFWGRDNKDAQRADLHTLCEHIVEAAQLRLLALRLQPLTLRCTRHGTKPGDILKAMRDAFQEVDTMRTDDIDATHVKHVAKKLFGKLERASAGEDSDYLMTGIGPVDELIGGFSLGSYVVMMAYQKMGKSTVSSAFTAGISKENPDAVISIHPCEGTDVLQLVKVLTASYPEMRHINQRALTRPDKLSKGELGDVLAQLTTVLPEVLGKNIYIEKPSRLRIERIESRVRLLRIRYPDRPLVVIVDYFQKVTAGITSNKQADYKEVSDRLQALAVENNALVITMSQLTKSDRSERAPYAMPVSGQVRGGDDVINDVDLSLTWHRPYANTSNHENFGILEVGLGRTNSSSHVLVNFDMNQGRMTWWEGDAPETPDLQTGRICRNGTHEPDAFGG